MNGTIPERNCDVVMKGGVTSGVVYPLVITELAEEFRFKNIGGTSAGAIAAAVTAAAEYRRVAFNGDSGGFARLAQLPEFLAGETNGEPHLLNLFPPAKKTRRLFNVITSLIGDGSAGEKGMTAFAALLVASPLITLLAFAPAVLLPFALRERFATFDFATIAMIAVVELVLLAAGALGVILGNAARALFVTLPRNRFGFSTGKTPGDRTLPGVSNWLHDEIQKIAGRTAKDAPLTFGDLWTAGDPSLTVENCEKDPSLRSINLQMMTTALTHGHPYRLPFENRRFAFRPSELYEYFPDEVVQFLVDHPRKNEDDDVAAAGDADLCPLPEAWNMPIVVAARMSLSFPLLFQMVPLYAVDYTRKTKKHERCWFLDGGLSSNFPISLFDSPFPRWPTFGINLSEFHPDFSKDPNHEENNVWMVRGAGSGIADKWTHFPDSGAAGFIGYVAAMVDAMRNWVDNTQLAVPGFRDRIAHVRLSPDEGGLNLAMDAKKVRALTARGSAAGRRLRERFGVNGAAREGLNWNTHRWARFRTYMALLQKSLRQMDAAFAHSDPAYPGYPALLARTKNENPDTGAYWWPKDVAQYQAATQTLLHAAANVKTPDFHDDKAPKPMPELRVRPRL